MAIRIRFTHFFDLLKQLIIWIGGLAGGFIPAILLGEAGFGDFFTIVVWIVGTIGTTILLMKFLDPLSTKLYLLVFCFTSVSYEEARSISFLFDGSIGGKWYPLSDLRNIDRDLRREILFEFASRMNRSFYSAYSKKSENRSTQENTYNEKMRTEEKVEKNENQQYPKEHIEACRIFDVPLNITKDELKKKYRELMKKYHPDMYSNENPNLKMFAEEKARIINMAYEYLSK